MQTNFVAWSVPSVFVLCVLGCAWVANVSALPLDANANANANNVNAGGEDPACRERTGTPTLPDDVANLITGAIDKTVSKFLDDSENQSSSGGAPTEVQVIAEYVTRAYQNMVFVDSLMKSQQGEIDEVTQHLLPNSQRLILENAKKARDSQQAVSVARQQLVQVAQSMPDDNSVLRQQQFSNVIRELRTMQQRISGDIKPLTNEQGVPSRSWLLQVSQTTTAQNSSSAAPEADLPVVVTVASPRERVLMLLTEVIENFKQLRDMERQHGSNDREAWSNQLDHIQDEMDVAVSDANSHRTFAYDHLKYSNTFKKYLHKITSRQYLLLGWHRMIQHDLLEFGRCQTDVQRLRRDVRETIPELLHYVKEGDTPYLPQPINGCDGLGAALDGCGVCDGSNITCVNCDGSVAGTAQIDVCGVCGDGQGLTCKYFCDSKANSGRVEDVCGTCNGNNQACAGCDLIPHSPLHFDTCGVCGGDGGVCAKEKGCVDAVCSSHIACPVPKRVTPHGFASCCFNPKVDCI